MAQDIQGKALSYLNEAIPDTDSSLKQRIATWIADQVLQERQGWKKKIQMAFKEVEKERKLALDVHARIHSINSKFQPYIFNLFLFREASMYHASDMDSKINHIDQLEKNLTALFDMINCYQEERIQCFQYLQIADNTLNLTDVLRKRIDRLEDQIKRTESDTKEMETRLNAEIKTANAALDTQLKIVGEERNQHNKKTVEMQKTISDLQRQLRHESNSTRSNTLTPRQGSFLQNSLPVTPAFNVNRSVSNINGYLHKDQDTQTVIPTRDCCIQVSLGARDIRKALKSQSKEQLLKLHSKSQDSLTIAQDVDITDLKPLPLPGTTAYPIKSITIVKKKNNGGVPTLDDVIDANNSTNHRLADVSMTSISARSLNNIYDDNPASHAKTARVVEFLRIQVTQLASKLEHSKQEVERYQQQLANMRQRAVHREGVHYRVKEEGKHSPTKGQEVTTSTSLAEGKLTGVKVKSESPRFMYTQQHQQNGSKNKFSKPNFLHGMAKCLRCNKAYRLSENNDHACRFHSKKRQQIEKYDSLGRLMRVNHQWSCCLQGGDAPGCQVGEHM